MKSMKPKQCLCLWSAIIIWIAFSMTLSSEAKSSELFGNYLFVEESSTYSLGAEAQILLKLRPPDIAVIIATKPKTPSLTDTGTFSIRNQKISIHFPGLGKKAADANFSFDKKRLILPILVIDDGEGTSTWERIEYQSHDLAGVVSSYHRELSAARSRDDELKIITALLQKNPRIKDIDIMPGKSILITYESGYQEVFLTSPGSYDDARRGGGGSGAGIIKNRWLTNVYLKYEPEPVSKGDAPDHKSALILSAFHTLPIYVNRREGVKYLTFRDMGENLHDISSPLRKSGYQISPHYVDEQVSVSNLYKLFNQSWGVVYFNTHGGVISDGDCILSTGEQIPAWYCRSDQIRDRYVANHLRKQLGNRVYNRIKPYILVGFIHHDVPFIAIRSGFFTQTTGDLSSSLVFINGCDSALNDRLRKAIDPRAFLGWQAEIDMELGGDINRPLWTCLSKKTRSAREAYDYGKFYLLDAKGYRDKRRNRNHMDPNTLALFRRNSNSRADDFTNAQRRMITAVREYAWLKKRSDKPVDLKKLVDALYDCTNRDINGMKSKPFCRKAFVGKRAPTKEIDEIKGELCGYGGAIVRFTLIEK